MFPDFSGCYLDLTGRVPYFQGVLATSLTAIYCNDFKYVLDRSVDHQNQITLFV